MDPTSPPASPPPRPRRGASAAQCGLLVFGTLLALGAAGGAALAWLTGNPGVGVWVAGRFALLGAAAGAAAGLVRLLGGARADRLFSSRLVEGDLGVIGGLVGGVLLAGYLAERQGLTLFARPAPVAVGEPVEVKGPTVAGGEFDLARHRGKVVLVDFWATWCVPCLEEMQNVRALYKRYHAEGLEVVGVSLDERRADLVKFLNAHPTPWPHIFFGGTRTSGWHNPVARQYGVDTIPCLVVIGRDGKVAAWDVRGREAATAVARALGKGEPPDEGANRPAEEPASWGLLGLLAAPPWVLVGCALGGALLLGLAEAGVRRALRRPVPTAPA